MERRKKRIGMVVSLALVVGFVLALNFQVNLAMAENLLANPGFEHGLEKWRTSVPKGKAGNVEFKIDDKVYHSGKHSASISSSDSEIGWASFTQASSIPLPDPEGEWTGQKYTVSCWIKLKDVKKRAGMGIHWIHSDGKYVANPPWTGINIRPKETKGWQRIEKEFTVPDDVVKINLFLSIVGEGKIWLDDVCLEKTYPEPEMEGIVSLPLKFDFGIDKFCAPGFIPVSSKSIYSREKGYGWINSTGLLDFLEKKTDDLCRDFTYFYKGQPEFKANLPNGEYLITLWMGSIEHLYTINPPKCSTICRGSYSVMAEDEKKVNVKIDSANFLTEEFYYKNLHSDYQKGDDVWKKYIASRYGPHIFKANVIDGQLNLKFTFSIPSISLWNKLAKSKWMGAGDILPINGLLIYPAENEQEWRKEMARIAEERREAFYRSFPMPEKTEVSKPAVKDKKGYLLFSSHYMKRIYPDTIPLTEEINKELRTFATPGEYEPISFGVYPLKNLEDVKVEVSNLKYGEEIIGKENINLRLVRYKERPSKGRSMFGSSPGPILIKPSYLYKIISPLNIGEGFTRSFQLTIKIPLKSKPGIYQGKISFKPQNAPASSLPLKLRVLPFKLATPSIPIILQMTQWKYDCPYVFFPDLEEEYWNRVETRYQDIKEHGLTSIQIFLMRDVDVKWDLANKRATFNPYYLKRCLSLYKKVGLPCREVSINIETALRQVEKRYLDYEEGIISLMEEIKKEVEKEGLKPIFLLVNEPMAGGGSKKVTRLLKFHRMLKEKAPQFKLMCLIWSCSEDVIMGTYSDFIGLHAAPEYCCPPALAKLIRKKGNYLLYNATYTRLAWGFYPWASGANGRIQEFYHWFNGDPYNFFDGMHPDDNSSCILPSPDGPVPFLCYEEIREGIDDWRYVLTLEALIKEARSKGEIKRAKDAENILEEVKNQINPDLYYYTKKIKKFPEGQFHDTLRWYIAAEIIKLKEVLK